MLLLALVLVSACGSESTTAADADGRHAVYLHGVDVDARTITVDVVNWLSGDEATEAYLAENPGEVDGPPNGYHITGIDGDLVTLPVADDVAVRLVRLSEDGDADLDAGTWDELPGYLSENRPDDGRLSYNPYWIEVEAGSVVDVEEQYIP